MRKHKILLIYIPDFLFINDEKMPYGLICLNEAIKNEGTFDVEIIDFNRLFYERKIQNIPSKMVEILKMVAQEISRIKADVVSFYTMCSNFYCCVPVAKELKKLCPDIISIMAGPHATCIARNILENYPFVDYVAMGEGEKRVVPFLKSILFCNNEAYGQISKITGIAYRKNGNIIIQWNKKDRISGNELPIIDMGKYFSVDPEEYITLEGG